jgi:dethiobiotin synthetase
VTRLFVTATGTEIGKTFVTAALLHRARVAGRSALAVKPVVSGFDPAAPDGSDPAVLAAALGLPPTAEMLERISPWRYRAPLSPDMAASREGRTIDVDAIIGFSRQALAGPEDCVLIEGVGGVMVPLDATRTIRDWIAALAIPVVLVAGTYLGTLSHTLTALAALRERGIALRAIVLSESPDSAVPLTETAETLARFTAVPILILPRRNGNEAWRSAPELTTLLD